MKKRIIAMLSVLLALAMLLASCGKDKTEGTQTSSTTTQGTAADKPSQEDSHGLYVDYYTGVDFKKYVTSGRVDEIDLVFDSGKAPAAKVTRSHYSIRFSGQILTKGAGVYTFTTYADDGAVLYVNGQQVIFDAGPHNPEYTSGSIELEGQTAYDICLEYYNGELAGTIQLLWESPDFSREVVPGENLLMPEKAVEVMLSSDGERQSASAMMRAFNDEEYTLVLEKHAPDGSLTDTVKGEREGRSVWSVSDTPESTDVTYTAYVTDKEGNVVSNAVTKKFGVDYTVVIDPSKSQGEISSLLYGACMEDVNHELYGGIWSQMIFGESFEEAPVYSDSADFTAAGGSWYVDPEGSLRIDNTPNGPKLLIGDSECTEGYIEGDIYVDGEGAGFIIKTSNASEGADNFDGYEISLFNNTLRLGKHVHNFTNLSDTACTAPQRTWVRLRVEFTENTMTAYVNGEKISSYTDSSPLKKGELGMRSWNASAKFKNVVISQNGVEKSLSFDTLGKGSSVSGMWMCEFSEGVEGYTSVITDHIYSGNQAQRLVFASGSGALSINNMGLNRGGMGFVAGKDYNGYILASSDSPIKVYAALESAAGVRYAETSFTVEGDYAKYSFSLTPDTTDPKGRFVIEIRSAGVLDVDYAFLETGEWGLYKGLHVRADVGEALENQGITVLRFGGCMANAADYKWKFMTGAPEDRGVYRGWWYNYSSYGFGIIEFMDLCEAMGVTYIPDFSSYESAKDMGDFAQFAFGTDPENEWVQLRAQMGRSTPYNLKYIQVGNEDKVDLAFANRFNAIANAVWQVNPDVIFIVGDFEYKNIITDPYSFTGNTSGITSLEGHKKILENAADKGKTVWFDIHFWSESGKDPYHFFEPAISFYNALHEIVPEADSALCVLELNANAHHFERALCNALAIKFAEEHSDIIKIMCSANCLQVQDHNDNGWNQGLLFMDTDSVWYQPAAYIDRIFLDAYLPVSLDVGGEGVKTVEFDVSASASEDGKTVCVKVLNRSGSAKGVSVLIEDFASKNVTVTRVEYSDSMKAVNTNASPENTKPEQAIVSQTKSDNGEFTISTEGYSVTVVTFTVE